MVGEPLSVRAPAPLTGRRPTRPIQWLNAAIFQAAWFACVLGAARDAPLAGTAAVAAALAWHLAVSARPAAEARLLAALLVVGILWETAFVQFGAVRYASGQPIARLAPYWMVAMWGLFAMAPNVTLRWLKRRPALAALIGAIAGPMSYAGGARLGAATIVDMPTALAVLAIAWAGLLPLTMWLSDRHDGVSEPRDHDRDR